MNVLVDLCIIPIGADVSLSKYVAACVSLLEKAGLDIHLHGYGTNVQGEWDEVFAAIKKCHEVVHQMGAVRISTTIRCGTRVDRTESFTDKIRSVEDKLSNH